MNLKINCILQGILLCLLMHAPYRATAMGDQSPKINISLSRSSLVDIFGALGDKTGYGFNYGNSVAKDDGLYDLYHRAASLETILSDIGVRADLEFKIEDSSILVRRGRSAQQNRIISGVVRDAEGNPLPGTTVRVKGTDQGVVADFDGNYSIAVAGPGAILEFSYMGFLTQEVLVGTGTTIDITLKENLEALEEVVVVGYGTQQKSDITGSVASISRERLDRLPQQNIAQVIQGSVSGIMIQQTSAGAAPSESIMIRGRNSIAANNNPLIVLDGIPFEGALRDVNVNDVQSIEILKDASAAAIYGSRGANGVIIITTKAGKEGRPVFSYNGRTSIQSYSNLPDLLTGEEFYHFKQQRVPGQITQSEQALYDSGQWADWFDLALRTGQSQDHNMSVTGGTGTTKYYMGAGLLNVEGLTLNDDYKRITGRVNLDTKITDWLTVGTRSQFSYDDRSGSSPDWADLYYMNPLTSPYDQEGKLAISPWVEFSQVNPLQPILFENVDEAQQLVSNNYINIDFPFVPGLSNRLNVGVRKRVSNANTYRGRDTTVGFRNRGTSNQNSIRTDNTVIENVLSYDREFGDHHIFATGVLSYEKNTRRQETLEAQGFPHDFMGWYASAQAESVIPGYDYSQTKLISQMLRMNYAYDDRYMLTLTARRDGYSGFGANNKWGTFPTVALGWNFANESFFPFSGLFNEFKPRVSYGLNGNQAVGAYQAITRLMESNIVSAGETQAGYRPSVLGMDDLGWESSSTFNAGLDFALLGNRVTGDVNYYSTKTTDLLLNRSISPVHGITSITQNLGQTKNQGVEVMLNSNNISTKDFSWTSSVNFSFNKNRIVSLYGELDDQGNEIDDVANQWFIGQPINVDFDFVWDGVWQLDQAEEAAAWGSQPGYVKIRDINGDGSIDENDRQIIGQTDPKFFWGMTQSFAYKNLSLSIFLHGSHGHKRNNPFMNDAEVHAEVTRNTVVKDWWTPENPTNAWYMNDPEARFMDGHQVSIYENAGFVRIKDITLSYDFDKNVLDRIGLERMRLHLGGRNLFVITDFTGLDPELSSQREAPLQREIIFGLDISI